MLTWFLWISIVAALLVAASTFALWSYGRFTHRVRGPESFRIPKGAGAQLDRQLGPAEARHPGQSAAATLFDNRDAFCARIDSLARAERSLDMQYYIWRDDLTGNLLAAAILEAADRGVRVRILLDDVNVLGLDPNYLDLSAHPQIEMRVFNPIRNRRNPLRRGVEALLVLLRYNRRMHNKMWLVDGRLAITGGRNIGNTYFDAARGRRRNSLDFDLLLAGPVVDDLGDLFDAFWNSDMAIPAAALWQDHVGDLRRYRRRLAALRRHRRGSRYLASLPAAGTLPGLDRLRWCQTIRLIGDPPGKALGQQREDWMPARISQLMETAQQSIEMMTPYFVPGREGMAELTGLRDRGVAISILTNSLSATDQILVHGAYRRYRHALLLTGVRILEYAPKILSARQNRMLHGKTILIDGRIGFIGSYNYDLRSFFLNTELGILFEDAGLAAELAECFARASAPDRAFPLSVHGRWIRWDQMPEDLPEIWYEPGAGNTRRGISWLMGHLPIHSYL